VPNYAISVVSEAVKTPKLWTILRWVAALGIITAGVILVVRGESSTSDQTARFTEEQQALRRAFGVFPDGSQSGDQGSANATARESIALLAIPSIDVDVVVVNYFGYSDLETAVARMQNSAQIGTEGSAVIVGHRTGFGSPFRNLDGVKIGDEVDVTLRTGEKLSFSVTRNTIVSPSVDLSTFDNKSNSPQVILVTCHPEYSTAQRLVIVAELRASATESA
jgi:LPXTG-site transpeptidase (sortase) family protein